MDLMKTDTNQTNKITEMNDKLKKKHYPSHLSNSFRILSAAEVKHNEGWIALHCK